MNARLDFLLGYVGSAALVAFLATCLDAPRVATYTCDTPPGETHEKCQLAETLPASIASIDEDDLTRVRVAIDAGH
jgi:hypothetical protein